MRGCTSDETYGERLDSAHLTATACVAMLAVKGAMMKPSRSLMLTKVRLAEFSLELKVYLQAMTWHWWEEWRG